MFLKSLKIENSSGIIREIPFHKGLNLIIDETTTKTIQETGNNVGKTTVLKLIDFCLAGSGLNIYKDGEFKDGTNTQIESFLKDSGVIITLTLKHDLVVAASPEIVIRKNFLSRKDKIQEVNGESYTEKDFPLELKKLIFHSSSEKPTFRQIISKNIRYEKNRLDNTLKVLHSTTTFEEYESLYFFWLGIETDTASKKHKLQLSKSAEETIVKRLKKETSLSEITQALSIIDRDISDLNVRKSQFNINEKYETDLIRLNEVKNEMNSLSTQIGRLTLRRSIIIEAKEELEKEYSNIDENQLKEIYVSAEAFIPEMHAKFSEMLAFHNRMLTEKIKFISNELPTIESELISLNRVLSIDIIEERALSESLSKAGAIEELEEIIQALNRKFEQKGRYEEQLRQWKNSSEKLEKIEKELDEINSGIASRDKDLENSIAEFNKYFSKASEKLYDEQFILSQIKNDRAYELNISAIGGLGTGKKKGQIAAFDIAYIQFCDDYDIPCLHFILHDQVENIHDNQLTLIAEIVNESNIQFIVPVLRDKLPPDINADAYKVISLSQTDKLFKI